MNFISNLLSVLCFLICFYMSSAAQEIKLNQLSLITKADSLKERLTISSGREKLAVIRELNVIYSDVTPDVALEYGHQYYSLALNLADSVEIVKGGKMIAYSLMNLGKNEEAVKILIKSLRIAQRNSVKSAELKNQIKFILNNAGVASLFLGNYDQALNYQLQSLKIREEDGDAFQIIRCLNNIGLIFYNLEDYEGSMQYLLRAERLCQEINETDERKKVLTNLGLCYIDLNKPQDAIIAIEKALSICGAGCSEGTIKEGEQGLGLAFFMQKDFLKAKRSFLLSLEISEKQKDTRYICENLIHLGQIEIALGNDALGISKLKCGLKLAEPSKLTNSKFFAYKELTKVYKRQSNLKNALFYLERYSQLRDSVYSSTTIKNLAKLQIDYAERENVETIKAKDQVILLNEELILKQRFQTILIASVAALLLLLAGLLYKFYRDKLLINIKLDQKVKERTEELRQNNSSLIHANEMQQSLLQKIGRDGQSIISAFKGLSHMAQLDIADERVKEYFQMVEANTDKLVYLFSRVENG